MSMEAFLPINEILENNPTIRVLARIVGLFSKISLIGKM